MIQAYLDESGIHANNPVCVIAGYYAGRGQWKRFKTEWSQLLSDFMVPPDKFHAHEIMTGSHFFRSWEPEKLQDFKWQIANLIAAHPKIHPISSTVLVDDFNAYSEKHRKVSTGAAIRHPRNQEIGEVHKSAGRPSTPYFAPFWYCVRQVAQYAPVGGKAHFFCGLNDSFAKYATVVFEGIKASPRRADWKERLGGIDFPLAKETPELQAADFLAYLQYRHTVKAHNEGSLGVREAFPLLRRCWANGRSTEDFRILDKEYFDLALEETYDQHGRWDSLDGILELQTTEESGGIPGVGVADAHEDLGSGPTD